MRNVDTNVYVFNAPPAVMLVQYKLGFIVEYFHSWSPQKSYHEGSVVSRF